MDKVFVKKLDHSVNNDFDSSIMQMKIGRQSEKHIVEYSEANESYMGKHEGAHPHFDDLTSNGSRFSKLDGTLLEFKQQNQAPQDDMTSNDSYMVKYNAGNSTYEQESNSSFVRQEDHEANDNIFS